MLTRICLTIAATVLAAHVACAADKAGAHANGPVQTAEGMLQSAGINSSDVVAIGVYPDKGYGGTVIDNHVWIRLRSCKGWIVQRVGNPADSYVTGNCSLARNPSPQNAER